MKATPEQIAEYEKMALERGGTVNGVPAHGGTTSPIHRITILHWRPATLNKLMRGKIKDRIKYRQVDHAMVAGYAHKEGVPRALGKRRVSLEITLTGKQKEFDVDSPWKGLFDALVSCGQLLGDTVHLVQIGELSFTRGTEPKTVILLEDLE